MALLHTARSRAEVLPERGGLVSTWTVEGEPVLFLDEATLVDPTRNVRGGVPLLFPFAGKPPPGSPLPQHGFARRVPWALRSHTEAALECALGASEETRAAFPFEFSLLYRVELKDSSLHLSWQVHNPGKVPLPLHFGIHPYFQAAPLAQARVEGARGRAFDNTSGVEREVPEVRFGSAEVDLHFAAPASHAATLHRGDGRRVRLRWSEQFTRLVVWSLPERPFVCVEPWTAPGGAPPLHQVAPGATEALFVSFTFER